MNTFELGIRHFESENALAQQLRIEDELSSVSDDIDVIINSLER